MQVDESIKMKLVGWMGVLQLLFFLLFIHLYVMLFSDIIWYKYNDLFKIRFKYMKMCLFKTRKLWNCGKNILKEHLIMGSEVIDSELLRKVQ